jgi:hypothetical protein
MNGPRPGADVAYLSDSSRLPKMLPNASQVTGIIACSHNDLGAAGATYLTSLDALLTAVRTQRPGMDVALSTQNPEAPVAGITLRPVMHACRRWQQIGWAKRNGLGVIDATQAFLDTPSGAVPGGGYLKVDGVHPETAGSRLWVDAITAAAGL